MARLRLVFGAALLTLAAVQPLHAQRIEDWQYKWYWGVNGGMILYSLPTSGRSFNPSVGAEWLLTQRNVALYLSYVQTFTAEQDTFAVNGLAGTNNTVQFDGYRQLQINVVALIGKKTLQPYAGAGFVLTTLNNARQTNASSTVAAAINDAASGGFLQVIAGVQLRFGKKGALYGHYQYTPQGRDFLLAGGAHTISGGLRWAFLASRETDPTQRR